MSSATSDSTDTTLLHGLAGYISQIQRKGVFSKHRFHSIRLYVSRSIGLSIVLYFILQVPFLVYSLLQLLARVIFFAFTLLFWPALQALRLVVPNNASYGIFIPLFSLLSVVSFFLAKVSVRKRHQLSRNYSFILAFLVILLLQTVFILRPIALSAREQRKTSPTPPAHRIESNGTAEQQMSSQSDRESDVKDKHSNLIDRDKLAGKELAARLPSKASAEQHANSFGSSSQEFRSPSAKKAAKQIRETLLAVTDREWLMLRQKFHNWLDEAWNVWHDETFIHSLSTLQMQHLPRQHVSSIYTAYTDGDCDEHTKSIDRQQLAKRRHLDVLDSYRRRSPFPVYLSVLKSNGPKCYGYYSDSSCANPARRPFAHLAKLLSSFGQFWMIISIPLLIFVLILRYYEHYDKSRSVRNHQIISNETKDLPLQQTSAPTTENDSLREEIENDLRVWFEREQRDGYRNMSETYRRALNDRCLQKHVSNDNRVSQQP